MARIPARSGWRGAIRERGYSEVEHNSNQFQRFLHQPLQCAALARSRTARAVRSGA